MLKKNTLLKFSKIFSTNSSVISIYSKTFSDYLKGTKCYREHEKEQQGDKKSEPSQETKTQSSTPITSDQSDLKENIDITDKKMSENKQTPEKNQDEMDEDLNTIHKESHNVDQGRRFKGWGMGRKENLSKGFPHGNDKI
jgi:prolyl-tRNA synthetase